jgi:putative flippase GtrA
MRDGMVGDWSRFTLVGASGLLVNQAVLVAVTEILSVHYLVSAVVATVGSSTWNFGWIERWAFASREPQRELRQRYLGFVGLNLALLPLRIPLMWLLTEVGQVNYALSNLTTLVAFFVVRVAVSDRWLWAVAPAPSGPSATPSPVGPPSLDPFMPGLPTPLGAEPDRPASPTPRPAPTPGRYIYDVAGLLAIDSSVELRELAYFRAKHVGRPDIRIRTGFVAPRPTRRVRFEEVGETLVYREHLGPFAANFSLRMGDPIEIRVSHLLALSPHVVYTNIVEAFLRFLLVSKGYVLLHSASIADEDGTTLLSAQTDTGKTSTVITLVRTGRYRFLSDDMTIIDPRGEAISYPKPMTLSFHTMNVAKAGRLTVRDRAALAVQSRLHSKSGRRVGQSLGERNLPIMSLNALVQAIVPPPKHRIDALFECAVGGRAPIRSVVIMERGEDGLDRLSLEDAVRRLIDNTDDAYGFPPFSLFAPHIRIDGDDYATLRLKEAGLLGAAIMNARSWHLRVVDHGWAERLPAIIERPRLVAVGPLPVDGHPDRGLPDALTDRGHTEAAPGGAVLELVHDGPETTLDTSSGSTVASTVGGPPR